MNISAYIIIKTGGILLQTVGGGVGSVSCDSPNHVLFFPLCFRPDADLIALFWAILIKCGHADEFS